MQATDRVGDSQIYFFFYYTMDKLLQLLNEYQTQRKSKFKFSGYDERSLSFLLVDSNEVLWEETIISKKFWFIEWLVLNMKINTDELMRHWHIVKTYDLDEPWDSYGYVDSLLMLLTIQDEPIDFLNSILK